ncbi:sn-glycerol-3-phosphate ABC transporter ATP-binding protein UgpC [candidate division WOR-3 bacterium]|nr:sn-glycerol-3-phosphate ABC transporter ATP-binding protein UgpC [candidate division WOR-3 bacterium]
MANVRLVALKKIYDKNVVGIEDINLEIEDKEFCVLVGPSGCGKSTTLRLIAGLETPTEGEIYIGDRLVNSVPPKDRDIAMVFQDYALYPHMTVFDNMAFALKLRKYPKEKIRKRVSDVSKLLGIEKLIKRRPRALSGGQRQRVAVGRAIVRNPQIFLFDEPLSNLDAKLRVEMRTEVKKLQRELGTTAVYVTHDQVEAMTMGDKIVILNEGLIQQIGDSKALYDNPINHFVAGFIGTPPMNFFQGIVDKGIFISSDGNIKMPLKRVKGKVTIGVRPEDIIIDTKGKIRARVELVEALGNEALLHLSIGEVRSIMRTYESPPKSDDTIDISFRSEKLHIFDTETGKRL